MEKLNSKIRLTLSEQVSNILIEYIKENNLQPNDKLPNEIELSKMINVSRSTIREAIKTLVSKNILYIKRGSGTYVSDKLGISDDPLGLLALSKDKIKLVEDLLEVRFMMEPNLAFSAALKATDEDIIKLEEQCTIVEDLIKTKKDHMEEDIILHQMIAKCSKNKVIENLIPIINSSIYVLCDITKRRLGEETIMIHREIINSIKIRDAYGAKFAMETHLFYNRQAIINLKNNIS